MHLPSFIFLHELEIVDWGPPRGPMGPRIAQLTLVFSVSSAIENVWILRHESGLKKEMHKTHGKRMKNA